MINVDRSPGVRLVTDIDTFDQTLKVWDVHLSRDGIERGVCVLAYSYRHAGPAAQAACKQWGQDAVVTYVALASDTKASQVGKNHSV